MDNHFKYGAEMKVTESAGIAHEGKASQAMVKYIGRPLAKPIVWMSKAIHGKKKDSKSKK